MKKKIIIFSLLIFLLTIAFVGMSITNNNDVNAANGSNTSTVQLLARAINGEARGEPYEGQVAVGAVILNRVKSSNFPNTVAGVIYQPGAFTAVSDGQIDVPIDSSSTVVKAARRCIKWMGSNRWCNLLF